MLDIKYFLVCSICFLIAIIVFMINIENKFTKSKRNYIIISLIIVLVLLFVSLFFVPRLLIEGFIFSEVLSNNDSNLIGDAFNGMLGPLIALASVVVTFLAFYIQKIANDQVRNQFKIQQFESQFFEMLRLHKENVNEMKIEGYDFEPFKDPNGNTRYRKFSKNTVGRKLFVTMQSELESILKIKKYVTNVSLSENDIKGCYDVFFNGLEFYQDYIANDNFYDHLKKAQKRHGCFINQTIRDNNYRKNYKKIGEKKIIAELKFNYKPYSGHASRLGHYYRHLYMTVRFVVEEPINDTYEKKMKYLKMLRAQLSNHEQIIMFYNWLSNYGKDWENKDNKFFTEYKMIHNLWYNKLLEDPFIKKTVDDLRNTKVKLRKGKMFEID